MNLRFYFDLLVDKIKNEPAVVIGAVVSAVVWVAGANDILLDQANVEAVLSPLLTGIFARFFVVPTTKVAGEEPGL